MLVGLPSIHEERLREPCMAGEHHNEVFDMGKAWRARKVMEFFQAHVCGPMNTQSLVGAKYFLLIVDDIVRYKHGTRWRNKEELMAKR